MPRRRKRISLHWPQALNVTRTVLDKEKLVYIVAANRRVRYEKGFSRIVYIGMTERGLKRIAESISDRAEDFLREHGIKELVVWIVTCKGTQRVKAWHKLERALIIRFRELFGGLPKGNKKGEKMKWKNELDMFSKNGLTAVLQSAS